jgi:hypothetical protein
VGKARRDRISNTHIRGELSIVEIRNYIERSRLRLFGHVKRMDAHRIQKRLLEMKMSGRISRGRPQA